MVKNQKALNKPVSDFVIGISVFEFVSDFDIRIADFVSMASWRDKKSVTNKNSAKEGFL
jgi:hypothetical protein